jgi:chloramphenicol O-acetyltransferase type A
MAYPHFGLCANVELTAFYPYVKKMGISFNVAIVYLLARAANEIPECRQRIRKGEVVEHDIVHPSTTVLAGEDLFSFCPIPYSEKFSIFAPRAAERIAYVQEHRTVEDDPGRDDLLYLTAMPWVSFTSVVHPIDLNPADSVPRIAWGKFFKEGELLKMPLGLQAHHALMDGIHVGNFYEKAQDYLDHPGFVLGEG